eukprot:4873244-Lingulodinium_polyedra.AAC.1
MNVHKREALPSPMLGSFRSGVATFGGRLVGLLVIAAPHGNPSGRPSSGREAPELPIQDAVEFGF